MYIINSVYQKWEEKMTTKLLEQQEWLGLPVEEREKNIETVFPSLAKMAWYQLREVLQVDARREAAKSKGDTAEFKRFNAMSRALWKARLTDLKVLMAAALTDEEIKEVNGLGDIYATNIILAINELLLSKTEEPQPEDSNQ